MQERQITRRGDSFDLDSFSQGAPSEQATQPEEILIRALSNPSELISSLGLTAEQARNVRSLITGTGAGLGSRYLAETFGDEIAGALGGLLGGYLSKKIIKRR